MSWLIKHPKSGQYFSGLGDTVPLGCRCQKHAHRFEDRCFALDVAYGIGAKVVKLVPRKVSDEKLDPELARLAKRAQDLLDAIRPKESTVSDKSDGVKESNT